MSNTRNWPRIGGHGITFAAEAGVDVFHSFRDWSLVASEIPVVAPAKPKTKYLEVPAASGKLDFTGLLSGEVAYENRTGSWKFTVLPDVAWAQAYSQIQMALSSKRWRIILDDDPTYYYFGRLSINAWQSKPGYSTIVIDYDLGPYKCEIASTAGYDWLWDDLFDVTIYYGTFDVSGARYRTFINPSGVVQEPVFVCSAAMTVTFNGRQYLLPQGRSATHGIELQPGDNQMMFSGNGRVLVDYSFGKML